MHTIYHNLRKKIVVYDVTSKNLQSTTKNLKKKTQKCGWLLDNIDFEERQLHPRVMLICDISLVICDKFLSKLNKWKDFY